MKKAMSQFLALCFFYTFSLSSFAEAPVIEDSENFAMLDEQQVVIEQPVPKAQFEENYPEEEIALARDNDLSSGDNVELLNKFKALQQELQELRGQLEVQTHQLKQLQEQQLTFYKDIDNRLLPKNNNNKSLPLATATPELNNDPKVAKLIPTQPAEPTVVNNSIHTNNPADEQIRYLAAYDLVKDKRFDDALNAMQSFIAGYPHGGYTANAHYWLGELYMIKKNYQEAITHFETVLNKFPMSSKAAACSLKIGYALAASGKEGEAKKRLEQVVKKYPDTPTAELAVTKLRSINAL